jgi:hypothetical protein
MASEEKLEALVQEPKYRFEGGRVINRASGEAIPLDEPVFVFRARDIWAALALSRYANQVGDQQHREAIRARVADFRNFAAEHPERMKEPDTDTAARPSPSVGVGELRDAMDDLQHWVTGSKGTKEDAERRRALKRLQAALSSIPVGGLGNRGSVACGLTPVSLPRLPQAGSATPLRAALLANIWGAVEHSYDMPGELLRAWAFVGGFGCCETFDLREGFQPITPTPLLLSAVYGRPFEPEWDGDDLARMSAFHHPLGVTVAWVWDGDGTLYFDAPELGGAWVNTDCKKSSGWDTADPYPLRAGVAVQSAEER